MIKHQKLPQNILQLIPLAADRLASNPKVLFAYLFGSLSKGRPLPLSDVDIAVYLDEKVYVPEDKLELLGEMTDVLQTDEIDLVVLNSAGLALTMNVLKNKKILVDKAP